MSHSASSTTTRILVLDANQRSALAITRSLGRHPNIVVLTSDETARSLAGQSRFSKKYLQSPSLLRDPAQFLNWLYRIIRSEGIEHLYPVTEASSYLCMMHRDRLGDCRLPLPELDTVLMLADKWKLMNLAEACHIPHPQSRLYQNGSAYNIESAYRFPVVMKPCFSWIWLGDSWLHSSVQIARSLAEMRTLHQEKPYFKNYPFMVQDYIPGHGAGIFALYDHGQAITFFAHQRIREKPPTGGVSVLSESVYPDPKMLDMAKRLLDAVHWHGVAMVEFRVTPEGEPYLMEVNTRFWGSLQLAIDAGVDFPHLLYQITAHQPVATPPLYRIGCRLRWLLGDLDSLYLCLRDQACFTAKQKGKRLLDFITPHPFTTRHEVDRLDDWGPAWHELKMYLRAVLRAK
ncbi:MAG TPA: ATP-grasp domain-containing protein [Candidatus Competibacter sp.]|nr:ATP-grasp domain-containing protein [Candidatus Competibacter sp.]